MSFIKNSIFGTFRDPWSKTLVNDIHIILLVKVPCMIQETIWQLCIFRLQHQGPLWAPDHSSPRVLRLKLFGVFQSNFSCSSSSLGEDRQGDRGSPCSAQPEEWCDQVVLGPSYSLPGLDQNIWHRFVPTNLRVKRDDGGKAGVPAGVHKPKKPVAPQYSSGLAPQQVTLKIFFKLWITLRTFQLRCGRSRALVRWERRQRRRKRRTTRTQISWKRCRTCSRSFNTVSLVSIKYQVRFT